MLNFENANCGQFSVWLTFEPRCDVIMTKSQKRELER